jgi:hypothetical protein
MDHWPARPIAPVLHHSNTPNSAVLKLPRGLSEAFDEAAFVQFGDEAAVHENFGFVVPDIRALLLPPVLRCLLL